MAVLKYPAYPAHAMRAARRCGAGVLIAAFGAALAPAGAWAAPVMTTSFFEPFDRLDPKRWYLSDGWANGEHQGCTWRKDHLRVAKGVLELRLSDRPSGKRAFGCAEIQTHQRFGYGLYEIRMRAAAGSGLNTALFTYSGPPTTKTHDEIDFEFLGKRPDAVQLNYFVNARGGNESLNPVGVDATRHFNTYAFDWQPDAIRWYINGRLVRTATGNNLPSVSGKIMISLWNGTARVNDWLGPFVYPGKPITAEVDWVAYTRPGERCLFPQSLSCAR